MKKLCREVGSIIHYRIFIMNKVLLYHTFCGKLLLKFYQDITMKCNCNNFHLQIRQNVML